MNVRLFGLFWSAWIFAGCLWQGDTFVTSGVTTRVTFLHTSDIHSRLFPFHLAPNSGDRSLGLDEANAPFGGVARLGYLIRRERQRSQRVLHVDSGDCFQGAPVFNNSMGTPEIRFLSDIGLDVAVIGNHEFDAGATVFNEQLAQWGAYDTLAANYDFPDPTDPNNHSLADLSGPFSLYNLDGIKIAVIGMANLGSLTSIGEGGNSLKIQPMEQNETVRAYVNLLHSSVDLVVVLTHLGLTEDAEILQGYEKVVWSDRLHPNWTVTDDFGDGRVLVSIPGVRGIDIIFGGHLHVVLNPPKVITDPDGREVPLVHSGAFSKFLGRFDAVLEDDAEFGGKKLVANKYQVFPVDERLANYEDPEISEMLEPFILDLARNFDLSRVVGYAPTTVTRFSTRGNGDSGLGNLVAESMRQRRRVSAEFGITNTLGIRDNFYAGPVTLEDMFNVFPFENALAVMYLSSAEVQELADYITFRSASRGCNSQAQVSGITFTMNCGQVLQNEKDPDNFLHPAEEIKINGVPIADNHTYKLATNDYIAKGGSGFKVLKRNTTKQITGVAMRDALIDYIATLQNCGEYEVHGTQSCLRTDTFSQEICSDIVDCQAYILACQEGCLTADAETTGATPDNIPVPTVCGGTGEIATWGTCDVKTQCVGNGSIRGPYASAHCIVSEEDGRLKRKTSDNLDSLSDINDAEDEL
jgi:5'-nucleotidase / UDP-sugar diphosphatase